MKDDKQQEQFADINDGMESPAQMITIPAAPAGHKAEHPQTTRHEITCHIQEASWRRKLVEPMSLFTAAILIATIGQWWATDGQLKVMRRQIEQTQEQIDIAMRGLNESQIGGDIAEIQAERSFGQNRDALKATLAQGQAALDASITASQRDQRPWVGPLDVTSSDTLAAGTEFKITIILKNVGRSPALEGHGQQGIWVGPATIAHPPNFIDRAMLPRNSVVTIFPNAQITQNFALTREDATEDRVSGIRDGRLRLFTGGIFEYRDTSGKRHWSKYCVFWDPPTRIWHGCDKYNETGDDPPERTP